MRVNKTLVFNAGSSSIKIGLFDNDAAHTAIYHAQIDGIGGRGTFSSDGSEEHVEVIDHAAATTHLLRILTEQQLIHEVDAIGHRVVHGGAHYIEPQRVTHNLLAYLQELTTLDPQHLPAQIALIKRMATILPDVPQYVCFDTAFHKDLPLEARLLPIPRRFEAKGVRRYGFHGLSLESVQSQLWTKAPTAKRVIVAHLGSGVSITAIKNDRSFDTTMGLTPNSGVPMSTRSGDIDPGIFTHIAHITRRNIKQTAELLTQESGLLGMSGRSADMEQLLKHETEDQHAKEAVAVFCYEVKKAIGAFTAAMGGLDALVFTGGMGVASSPIRARACAGLEYLGVRLSSPKNNSSQELISDEKSSVKVYVLRTEEERVIAGHAQDALRRSTGNAA